MCKHQTESHRGTAPGMPNSARRRMQANRHMHRRLDLLGRRYDEMLARFRAEPHLIPPGQFRKRKLQRGSLNADYALDHDYFALLNRRRARVADLAIREQLDGLADDDLAAIARRVIALVAAPDPFIERIRTMLADEAA